jgi:hypothetical protein
MAGSNQRNQLPWPKTGPVFSPEWFALLPADVADVMRSSQPHIEAAIGRARQRRNAPAASTDTSTETLKSEPSTEADRHRHQKSHPHRKGSTVSHLDEQLSLLNLCREKLEVTAGNAISLVDKADEIMSGLRRIEQEVSEVSGYTAQAIGMRNMGSQLSGPSTIRAQAEQSVSLLADQLGALAAALASSAELYARQMAKIQAAADES